LQVQKGFIRVTFNLQAFGPLEIRLTVFFIKIDGDSEILNCLTEIAKNSKNQTSKIKIFWNVVLALLYSFINITYSFVEIIPIELKDGPEIEES